MDLNQLAVVTGGASGMGFATAQKLLNHGAQVCVFDKKTLSPSDYCCPERVTSVEVDVADEEKIETLFSEITQTHGVPRIIVNCAGICPPGRMVSKTGPMPLSDFEAVLRVNLLGSFNVMRIAAKWMIPADPLNADNERGVLINTASVAAFEGQVGQSAYSASKGALVSMTLPLARELADFGIRVMAIAPGLVETPMLAELPDSVKIDLAQTVPFPKRLASAEEFADTVAYIVQNRMMNGSTIRLDGALRMQAR